MDRPRLSENEKVVVLSLMRNPEHSDTEISGSIGMNLFTFNKVKNSLLKRNILTKHYVPNYARIGFEILLITHGSLVGDTIEKRFDEKTKLKLLEITPNFSIFQLMESTQGMSFHVLENFTSMKKLTKLKGDILGTKSPALDDLNTATFSLRDIRISRFFDVASLFEMCIDGDRNVPILTSNTHAQIAASKPWPEFFNWKEEYDQNSLDAIEIKVLIEMVKNPSLKESEIMRNLGLSRYKLNTIRDRLYSEGFIKPFYIGDIMSLGFDVLLFTHLKFTPGLDPMEIFREYHDVLPVNLSTIIFDGMEGFVLGAYHNLSKGSEEQKLMRDALMKMKILESEPVVKIFSLPNCINDLPLSLHRPMVDKARWKDPLLFRSEISKIIS